MSRDGSRTEIQRVAGAGAPVADPRNPAFRDALGEWTDIDTAQFQLGVTLGLFEPDSWFEHKGTMWSDNPLGNALASCLDELTAAGVLEKRDEPDFQDRAVQD